MVQGKFDFLRRNLKWVIIFIGIVAVLTPIIIWIPKIWDFGNGGNGNGNGDDNGFVFPRISGREPMLKVNNYSQATWEQTVGHDSYPDDIFGGEADKINATCKYLIKGSENSSFDIFDVIEVLVGISFSEAYKLVLRETYDVYGVWRVWNVSIDYWDFTTHIFYDHPDKEISNIPIFQDPKDFSEIFVELQKLSFDPEIPNITAKIFTYYMVIKGFPLMTPVNEYLDVLIDEIASNDVYTFCGKESCALGISYNNGENYRILAYYSDIFGMIDSLYFMDENNTVFYSYSIYVEIAALFAIHGYKLSLLLFLSSFTIIGLIFVIKRKIKLEN